MKIEFHTNNVILTSKQKAEMEKKLFRTKKYIPDEPVMIDVILQDESSSEKGGIDQMVKLSATFGKERIYIEEVDERLMRAFAIALQRFERDLERFHEKRTDKNKKPGGLRWEKVLGIIRLKRNKKPDIENEE
jgi:ribosomal subunit interface protein